MTQISASDVGKLRRQTGSGMMDCNKALIEANGDFDQAVDILRKKGQKVAAKRADRQATEGVVIAKNNETHENLSKQFSDHTIIREYQLLIWGKLRPSSGRIETFITRSSKNRQLMEVSSSKGKKAITNYKTLEIFENQKTPTLSLVECKLETGRTHQIRVHMNYKGNSLVGDDKYKKKYKKLKNIDFNIQNSIAKLNRQFLHAKNLGFIHPRTKKEMIFSSLLPQDLNNILKMLRNTEE